MSEIPDIEIPDIGGAGDARLRLEIRNALLAFMERHDGAPVGAVSAHAGVVCLEYAAATMQAAGWTTGRFARLARRAFKTSEGELARTLTDVEAAYQPAPEHSQ